MMGSRYEPVGRERFTIEHFGKGELIRIRARRQWFAMLFLSAWLVGWTAGGVAAIGELSRHLQLFLLCWLGAWLVGWIFAAANLAWMITGSETLAVVGPDLEVAHYALGVSRRWLYRGADIRHLSVSAQPAWPFRLQSQTPFLRSLRSGSVQFDYGPRTIFAAPGLDPGEARIIVDRLVTRLSNNGPAT